jgi:hypothetical protein
LALNRENVDFFNIGKGIGTRTLELYQVIYETFWKNALICPRN